MTESEAQVLMDRNCVKRRLQVPSPHIVNKVRYHDIGRRIELMRLSSIKFKDEIRHRLYLGYNYLGYNYLGYNYLGYNYLGYNYLGYNYLGYKRL